MIENRVGQGNESSHRVIARIASGFERVRSHLESTHNRVAREYLNNFGLTWKSLRGKKILDIGSGMGGFAAGAKKKRVEVVAFDKETAEMGIPKLKPFRGIRLVIGDALKLHEYFPEERFDTVVSRRAVKYMVTPRTDRTIVREEGDTTIIQPVRTDDGATTPEEMKNKFGQLFSEVKQVLNDGGEFRFDSNGWMEDLYSLNHEPDPTTPQDELAQNAHTLLQEVDPNISMDWGKDARGHRVPFFILRNNVK